MKRLILILVPLMVFGALSAVPFDLGGEMRVRAALYNDTSENDGGHIDNRLTMGFDSQFHKNLAFRFAVEIGNIGWGSPNGGAIGTNGVNIETSELYLDYLIDAIDAKLKVGQQYWADNMGLIMDDNFSGILLSKEDWMGIDTELAWMKADEGFDVVDDDYNIFMAHAAMKKSIPLGMYAFYGKHNGTDFGNITLMPYTSLDFAPIKLDVNAFLDMQMKPGDDDMGMGAAMKAKIDLDAFEIGADLLLATENGLTTISSWYQNGLYIYGVGKHHDGVNRYWWTNNGAIYQGNTDFLMSAVANIRMPIKQDVTAFAAFGLISDTGMEVNAGFEYELIPDLLHWMGYGAYGMHDNDTNNYLLGTTMKVCF